MYMHDCNIDVLAHHDKKVTLPQPERTEMRERRDANRERLKKGLKDQGKPSSLESKSQGSYAMKTMVQHPKKDYDIDDGSYFSKEDLVGGRGVEMTSLQVRQMVRDALDDGSFNTPPEVRKNCVRVYYKVGYHVDVPVYRRVLIKNPFNQDSHYYELASSEWKRSDARKVTEWFEKENEEKSPDATNGRQLRRITRQIKKYARSRPSWSDQILSGFGISKLVTETFYGNADREDKVLYNTMKAIRDRLNCSLVVHHPVTPGETITNGNNDAKARFLRDRLTEAIDSLAPLFELGCTREKALKCWDKVFDTTFFIDRLEETSGTDTKADVAAPNILTQGLLSSEAAASRNAVRKGDSGRYA